MFQTLRRSKNRIRDNLPKDNLPHPNLRNVKDNLPKIIRQIVPESIFGKSSFRKVSRIGRDILAAFVVFSDRI